MLLLPLVMAETAGSSRIVTGKFFLSNAVSMPPDARFLVYVYAGRDAPKDSSPSPLGKIESIAEASKYKPFQDFVTVPAGTEWLTFHYEITSGPAVRMRFQQESREAARDLNDLYIVVYSLSDTATTLRQEATGLATKEFGLAQRVFEAAYDVADTDGQRLETLRVQARSIAEIGKDPAQALAALSKAVKLDGFPRLPERVRQGYWTERFDYFEKTAFGKGYERDSTGAFATAIIKNEELTKSWDELTLDFETAPPKNNLRVALTNLPTITKQDRGIKLVMAGMELSAPQVVNRLASINVPAVAVLGQEILSGDVRLKEEGEFASLLRQLFSLTAQDQAEVIQELLRHVEIRSQSDLSSKIGDVFLYFKSARQSERQRLLDVIRRASMKKGINE